MVDARASRQSLWVLLALAIAAGLAVRLYILATSGALNFDELVTASLAQKPIAESWQYLRLENYPPLHTWLLHLWGLIFGFSDSALRSLSVALFVPSALALYLLGRALLSRSAAIAGVSIFALVPFSVYHTVEARAYGLLLLLITLSTLLFWRLLRASPRRWYHYAAYVAVTVLSLHTSLTALALLVSQAAYLVIFEPRERRWPTLGSIAASAACFSPWLAAFVATKAAQATELGSGSWYFNLGSSVPVAVVAPLGFFLRTFGRDPHFASSLLFAGAATLLGVAVAAGLRARASLQRRNESGGIAYLATILVLPLAVSSLTVNLPVFHYYLPSAIAYYLLLGLGWHQLTHRLAFRTSIAVALAVAATLYSLRTSSPQDVWRVAANYVEASHPDAVVTTPVGLAMGRYLSSPKQWVAVLPPGATAEQGDHLRQIISYNYSWDWSPLADNDQVYIQSYVRENLPASASSVAVFLRGPKAAAIKKSVEGLGFYCSSYLQPKRFNRDSIAVAIYRRGTSPISYCDGLVL